jgi:hypothetical protein
MADIVLNGATFKLRDDPPKAGRLMLLARAEKRGEQDAMAAYLDLIEAMLAEGYDESSFERCIAEMEFEEIGEALREAALSYKVDPSSAGRTSSTGSSVGSPTGERTSRVVSFSQGRAS